MPVSVFISCAKIWLLFIDAVFLSYVCISFFGLDFLFIKNHGIVRGARDNPCVSYN